MALFIEINKVEEDNEAALYSFCTDLGSTGKVSINKQTGECFIIEESENDKDSKLAIRVMRVLIHHWRKGEFPDITCWAS